MIEKIIFTQIYLKDIKYLNYKNPIVGEGKVLLDMPYGSKEIGIERLHLEQDAGKSIHDMDPSNTYVDLNRSGIALMEIVNKPDVRSPDEVNAYIKKLRSIMRYPRNL